MERVAPRWWFGMGVALFGCGSTSSSATAPSAVDGGVDGPSSVDGASSIDGSSGVDGAASYPPLRFTDIGQPVLVSGQFLFTEGPVWDPAKEVLYFTDINASMIYQLTLPDTFAPLFMPDQNADGLALDPQGNIIAAGFVSRSIWRLQGQTMQTIASSYMGQALNSPDDIIARSDGVIYFTDPLFGIDGAQGFAAQTQALSFQGVYRVTTDGTLHLEDQTSDGPNGVELSPDEHTLYVSYTNTGEVYTFAVAADGSVSDKKLFASGLTVADSMCVDAAGNVYVATLSGIAVLSPAGAKLGTIPISTTPDGGTAQVPTNGAFGGPDQKSFFITARTSLTAVPTAGNASLYRIDGMPVPGLPGRP